MRHVLFPWPLKAKKDAGLASFRCFCLSHARTFLFVPKRDAIATGSAEAVTLTLGLAAGLSWPFLFWIGEQMVKQKPAKTEQMKTSLFIQRCRPTRSRDQNRKWADDQSQRPRRGLDPGHCSGKYRHKLESSLHFQIFPPFLVLPRDCPMQPEVRPGPVASILRGWRCNRAGKSGVNRGNPVYFFVGHRDLRAFLADTDHFCFRRGK